MSWPRGGLPRDPRERERRSHSCCSTIWVTRCSVSSARRPTRPSAGRTATSVSPKTCSCRRCTQAVVGARHPRRARSRQSQRYVGVSRASTSSAGRRPAADRVSGDPVPAAGVPGAASARRRRHQADGQSHPERRYREPHPAALRRQRARRDPALARPGRRHRPRARRLAFPLRSGHERAPCAGAVGRRGFRRPGRQQPQRDRARRARRHGAARSVADPGGRQAAADRDSGVKICPVCATQYRDDVRFCPNDGQTLRSSGPTHDLVGQVLADRYHIMKKLGEGGMGQVYLAEHVKMGRRSAIKVMNPSMVHDPEAVARFNREAANASRISDSHVCAIYDFGETEDGLIYLAMEFVEGAPLTDLLASEGALPVARAADISTQVAAALQAAHDLGIVHRDLKPDNIMLTRGRDGADAVKVVDFGLAKAVGGETGNQKVTKTGLVVGTPEFMSPEQLSGDTLDGRSDVYSLGLVPFKMLTGTLPSPATTVPQAMIKRLTDEPAELIEMRPDLHFPPGLQQTLDTALARSPADRYQSAAKFAHDVAIVVGLSRTDADTALPTLAEEET